jgi:hypothetical protein
VVEQGGAREMGPGFGAGPGVDWLQFAGSPALAVALCLSSLDIDNEKWCGLRTHTQIGLAN